MPSIAPKQDEVRLPELWRSGVQETLSNLLPKLLKGKRGMQVGFCCTAHINVAVV